LRCTRLAVVRDAAGLHAVAVLPSSQAALLAVCVQVSVDSLQASVVHVTPSSQFGAVRAAIVRGVAGLDAVAVLAVVAERIARYVIAGVRRLVAESVCKKRCRRSWCSTGHAAVDRSQVSTPLQY